MVSPRLIDNKINPRNINQAENISPLSTNFAYRGIPVDAFSTSVCRSPRITDSRKRTSVGLGRRLTAFLMYSWLAR